MSLIVSVCILFFLVAQVTVGIINLTVDLKV